MAVQSLKPRIDLIKKRFGEDKDKVSKETNLLYEQVSTVLEGDECHSSLAQILVCCMGPQGC